MTEEKGKAFDKWINDKADNYADWDEAIRGDHEIVYYLREAFKSGIGSFRPEIERLKKDLFTLSRKWEQQKKDKEELIEILMFIHDECDWDIAADKRIGEACRKAIRHQAEKEKKHGA